MRQGFIQWIAAMQLAFEQPGPGVKRFSLMTKSREKLFQKQSNRPSSLSG